MDDTQYIVTGKQIISTIRSALEDNIQNSTIIRELMTSIENNVWTVLEDDCEEFIGEDWEYIGERCRKDNFR